MDGVGVKIRVFPKALLFSRIFGGQNAKTFLPIGMCFFENLCGVGYGRGIFSNP
jgi:hypothetical protein